MSRRRSGVRTPYENYELPQSSEKGEPFIEWNEVNPHGKPVRIIRKKRGK
jgi:hypothetical protein